MDINCGLLHKLKFILIILALSNCVKIKKKITTIYPENNLVKTDRAREASSYSLEEKKLLLDNRFKKSFLVKDPAYLVLRYNNIKDPSKRTIHIDETALYLAYLAFDYKNSSKIESQNLAKEVIKGIIYFDKLNKLDGFIPRHAYIDNNKITISKENIRNNSYSILLFSYLHAFLFFDDLELKSLIKEHTELILDYYIKNNFELYTPQGKKVKYTDLNSSFILSRKLDALAIFEAAYRILGTDTNKELTIILENIRKKHSLKYIPLDLDLLFYRISTPSSDWLNLLKLYTIARSNPTKKNYKNFTKLYKKLKFNKNVFYDLLYLDLIKNQKKPHHSIKEIERIINSFPIDIDNYQIINSNREDIKLKKLRKIKKHTIHLEAKEPLPIYQRPLVYFEWKHSQIRVDGNLEGRGEVEYSGLDFLLALEILKNIKTK